MKVVRIDVKRIISVKEMVKNNGYNILFCDAVKKINDNNSGTKPRILMVTGSYISYFTNSEKPKMDRERYWASIRSYNVNPRRCEIDLEFADGLFRFMSPQWKEIQDVIFDVLSHILSPDELGPLQLNRFKIPKFSVNGLGVLSRYQSMLMQSATKSPADIERQLRRYLPTYRRILPLVNDPQLPNILILLGDALKPYKHFESLILPKLPEEGLKLYNDLAQILIQKSPLRHISVANSPETTQFIAFCDALRTSQITGLTFRDVSLTQENLSLLHEALMNIPFRSLSFQNSISSGLFDFFSTEFLSGYITSNLMMFNMDRTRGLDISRITRDLPEIRSLSFAECDLDISVALNTLGNANLPKLKFLNLSGNYSRTNFGEDTAYPHELIRLDVNDVAWSQGTLPSFISFVTSIKWKQGLRLYMERVVFDFEKDSFTDTEIEARSYIPQKEKKKNKESKDQPESKPPKPQDEADSKKEDDAKNGDGSKKDADSKQDVDTKKSAGSKKEDSKKNAKGKKEEKGHSKKKSKEDRKSSRGSRRNQKTSHHESKDGKEGKKGKHHHEHKGGAGNDAAGPVQANLNEFGDEDDYLSLQPVEDEEISDEGKSKPIQTKTVKFQRRIKASGDWAAVDSILEIAKEHSITELGWNGNPVSVSLINFLLLNPHLDTLFLSDCFTSDYHDIESLNHFTSTLNEHMNLKRLVIKATETGTVLGTDLYPLLKELNGNTNIALLDVSGHRIHDKGINLLTDIVENCPNLTTLIFDESYFNSMKSIKSLVNTAEERSRSLSIQYPLKDLQRLYQYKTASYNEISKIKEKMWSLHKLVPRAERLKMSLDSSFGKSLFQTQKNPRSNALTGGTMRNAKRPPLPPAALENVEKKAKRRATEEGEFQKLPKSLFDGPFNYFVSEFTDEFPLYVNDQLLRDFMLNFSFRRVREMRYSAILPSPKKSHKGVEVKIIFTNHSDSFPGEEEINEVDEASSSSASSSSSSSSDKEEEIVFKPKIKIIDDGEEEEILEIDENLNELYKDLEFTPPKYSISAPRVKPVLNTRYIENINEKFEFTNLVNMLVMPQ